MEKQRTRLMHDESEVFQYLKFLLCLVCRVVLLDPLYHVVVPNRAKLDTLVDAAFVLPPPFVPGDESAPDFHPQQTADDAPDFGFYLTFGMATVDEWVVVVGLTADAR
ncbi:hypothetical protein HG530_000142 [Fusarium avenaceum]|nr:hypothetical protein HG530_000142 [Fusarium avenaceum]